MVPAKVGAALYLHGTDAGTEKHHIVSVLFICGQAERNLASDHALDIPAFLAHEVESVR